MSLNDVEIYERPVDWFGDQRFGFFRNPRQRREDSQRCADRRLDIPTCDSISMMAESLASPDMATRSFISRCLSPATMKWNAILSSLDRSPVRSYSEAYISVRIRICRSWKSSGLLRRAIAGKSIKESIQCAPPQFDLDSPKIFHPSLVDATGGVAAECARH